MKMSTQILVFYLKLNVGTFASDSDFFIQNGYTISQY